jgi:hypothetical protein
MVSFGGGINKRKYQGGHDWNPRGSIAENQATKFRQTDKNLPDAAIWRDTKKMPDATHNRKIERGGVFEGIKRWFGRRS